MRRNNQPKPVNILETIVAQKKLEVAKLSKRKIAATDLHTALQQRGPRRDFAGALRRPKTGAISLIAEVKKASPSAGVFDAQLFQSPRNFWPPFNFER